MARRRPELLEGMTGPAPLVSRRDYLVAAFSRRIDFTHRSRSFSYIKITEAGGTIIGRVGRPGVEHLTSGPESGFAPQDYPGHLATNLFVDTDGDSDGQKLAYQINPRVGAARRIVEALIQRINDMDVDTAWQTEVHPIIDEETFWAAAEKNASIITSLQLSLVAPNILGFKDSVSEEMKRARDENNAASVDIKLSNKDGIKLDTLSIRNAVHYVSEGGGDAIIRSRKKKLFDSRERKRSIPVDGDTVAAEGKENLLELIKRRLFGK